MGHEWKIGDWAEYKGVRYLCYNVTSDGYGVYLVTESAYGKDGHCSLASNDSDLKHLPDCTGWDWKPPKPISPPPGYRLLSDGERIEPSDLFLFGADWETGAQVGVFTYHLHVPHARKIEPKYRPFANAAEFAPHRDKWFKWKNQDRHVMRFGLYSDFVVVPACASVGSSFAEAFEKWTFEDGSPFGVLES